MDHRFKLASSVHKAKGAYALLVCSGLSRSAGILTGHEVMLDLVGRLAQTKGGLGAESPKEWYRRQYDRDPHYSRVLQDLTDTRIDRMFLLKDYFEPTPEERERGEKLPTIAHRAIARLVRDGYVKLILTTNFDRLIEQSLEAEGVQPKVISTSAALGSSPPLQHLGCVVLKIHGDYQDSEILNTQQELSNYAPGWMDCLKRIGNDYGMIIAGWSATSDTSLANVLRENPCQHFSTYFTVRGTLTNELATVMSARAASKISVDSADEFFKELYENIDAMESYARREEPTTVDVAVARAKKYLSDSKYQIDLHDFVIAEAERVYQQILPLWSEPQWTEENLAVCERSLEKLISLLATGCYWEQQPHNALWRRCLERITDPQTSLRGATVSPNNYSSIVCLYAGGVAALCRPNYDALSSLLVQAKTNGITLVRHLGEAFATLGSRMPDLGLNNRIYEILRRSFSRFLFIEEEEFRNGFDLFEYIFALQCAHFLSTEQIRFCPLSRCGRTRRYQEIKSEIQEQMRIAGADWPITKAGLFDASLDRATTIARRHYHWINGEPS